MGFPALNLTCGLFDLGGVPGTRTWWRAWCRNCVTRFAGAIPTGGGYSRQACEVFELVEGLERDDGKPWVSNLIWTTLPSITICPLRMLMGLEESQKDSPFRSTSPGPDWLVIGVPNRSLGLGTVHGCVLQQGFWKVPKPSNFH